MNSPDLSSPDRAAVDATLRSGWIGTGPQCAAFERELADFLGAPDVVCLSSCTAALELVYDYLQVGVGTRVAVPAWTYAATATPAAIRGAQVVLVDSDPDSLAMDSESLSSVLETGVDVVVPVHFGGTPVPADLHQMCADAGVPVIEDAAHAFGATDHRGVIWGSGSVAAAFSFHATKNLTCGEGGAVSTEDAGLASFLRRRRNIGLETDAWTRSASEIWGTGDLASVGRKANMPDLLAALGRSQLLGFVERQRVRRRLVERYRAQLEEIDVQIVPRRADGGSSDHLFVIALPRHVQRSAVVSHLLDRGITTGQHYRPLHQLSWFRAHAEFPPGGLKHCDDASARALTLPLHSGLSMHDVDTVCAVLREFMGSRRRAGAAGSQP